MADRNERREPRWNNSGYWIDRGDDDERAGDQELARDYDREDMRRYGRHSLEQGERMRAMRGQNFNEGRDYRHRGSDWKRERPEGGDAAENRVYRGGPLQRGPYNSEMARGRGYERYRGGGRYEKDFDPYDTRWDGEVGNFWGERQRWNRYRQPWPWRDFPQGRDHDYLFEDNWDDAELDREFDLDPGYSYEFGTDYALAADLEPTPPRRGRRWWDFFRRRRADRPERAAWDVPGEFSGVGPTGYRRSHERIAEEINDRLARHGRLDARHMQVDVEDGVVTLSGDARSKHDKYLAEYLAETASGVREVHNHIRVTGSGGARVRGMGHEDVVMPGRVRAGMRVAGVDGKTIGTVRAVRGHGFVLDRPNAGQAFIPFRAVKRTNGQIFLHVTGNEIDRQGWRE